MITIQKPRRGSLFDHHQSFEITCINGHETTASAEDLEEDCFELDHFECPVCEAKGAHSDPDIFYAECNICGNPLEFTFDEYHIGFCRCYGKAEIHDWRVIGTPSYFRSIIKDFYELSADKVIQRPDFWDVVTHYTSQENFVSILESGQISASSTGFYGSRTRSSNLKYLSRAVCLTETPIQFTQNITERFGDYGFAFLKPRIIEIGGGPAINIPKKTLDKHRHATRQHNDLHYGWSESLLPFINKIDDNFNYLHEREWRVPSNINIENVRPWLVLPEDFEKKLYRVGVEPRSLARWLTMYGRIVDSESNFTFGSI